MAGSPLKAEGKRCGARRWNGQLCRSLLLLKGNKCKFHGGMSTGPKTPQGKAKSYAARDAGRARYWQRRLAALAGLAGNEDRKPKA